LLFFLPPVIKGSEVLGSPPSRRGVSPFLLWRHFRPFLFPSSLKRRVIDCIGIKLPGHTPLFFPPASSNKKLKLLFPDRCERKESPLSPSFFSPFWLTAQEAYPLFFSQESHFFFLLPFFKVKRRRKKLEESFFFLPLGFPSSPSSHRETGLKGALLTPFPVERIKDPFFIRKEFVSFYPIPVSPPFPFPTMKEEIASSPPICVFLFSCSTLALCQDR